MINLQLVYYIAVDNINTALNNHQNKLGTKIATHKSIVNICHTFANNINVICSAGADIYYIH